MEESPSSILHQRALAHLLDVFVNPEIKRRQDVGQLPAVFAFRAAQIIFYADGRKPELRIDDEVRALAKLKLKEGIIKKAGDPILASELDGLADVRLTDTDDPDCGHATIVRVGDTMFLAFDFVYNKGLAAKHVKTGDEFLLSAEQSNNLGHRAAFVDNLFSAAELYVKAILLNVGATPGLRTKASHKEIAARFKRFACLGNIDPRHRAAFNSLSRLRGPARYLKGNLSLTPAEASSLLEAVSDLRDVARRWARIETTPS
jgi:HEPN domain-containing protein